MKKKVKVNNDWGFRIFLIQVLSIISSILLVTLKLFGVKITWLQALLPIIASVGLPILVIILLLILSIMFFGTIYLFKDKEKRTTSITICSAPCIFSHTGAEIHSLETGHNN